MFLNEKVHQLNTYLSAIANLVKFGLKSALKKICEKRTVRRKAVLLWEKSCHTYKLFLSAKAAMVLRSQQKNRQIDGANYSTQLPFSVKY